MIKTLKAAGKPAAFSVPIKDRHAGRMRKRKVNFSKTGSQAYVDTAEPVLEKSKQQRGIFDKHRAV